MKKTIGLSTILMTYALVASQGRAEIHDNAPVIVKVPDDLKYKGILRIDGKQGKGQPAEFLYRRCEVTRANDTIEIKRTGCSADKKAALNSDVSVQSGFYLVTYSESRYPDIVEIKQKQKTRIKLRKILVPQEEGKYHFNVFRDLTNLSEQKKLVRAGWGINNPAWAIKFCDFREAQNAADPKHSETNAEFVKYCTAARTDNLDIFRENQYEFNSNNTYAMVNFTYNQNTWRFEVMPHFVSQGRIQITDPVDGDFTSVFPGVYMLVFNDSVGDISAEWGIEVEKEFGDLSNSPIVPESSVRKRK